MDCSCGEKSETTFLSASKGVCRECSRLVEVRYISQNDKVYLERYCDEHGTSRALVAESLAWYLKSLHFPITTRVPQTTIRKHAECPYSCGPCSFHAQRCNLPVFSITNCCDLRCPICFTYNRADRTFFMSPAEFDKHIDFVVESTGNVDLINITGGEPTLHPELFDLLKRADRPEIGRITMNTNGLQIAGNPEIARRLAEMGVYAVISLDTLDRQRSKILHGRDIVSEKKKALEYLEKYDVQTTLLVVLVGGVNEDELGDIVELALEKDFIRSLTIQTMAYTGQGGGNFSPRRHIPVDGVEKRIEIATNGLINMDHFFPLPTAHPLCYGVCYLLVDQHNGFLSFTDLFDSGTLASHLSEGYFLKPSDRLEQDLKHAINTLWSKGGNEDKLAMLKTLLKKIYPTGKQYSVSERQRLAETMIKTIYIHAHMDEDTYEIGRAMRCPDQVPVHAEKLVGACNYNLFYRMNDERFWETG